MRGKTASQKSGKPKMRMQAVAEKQLRRSLRRQLAIGTALLLGLVGAVGGWAAATEISGAVIAPGRLVVESDVKKVQHPTGGIVGELLVKEGDIVEEGQLVVRLDETQTRANLTIITKLLDELAARRAREETEQRGLAEIAFPEDLRARKDDPNVAQMLAGEQKLFEVRSSARDGQKAQLREETTQLEEQIRGLAEQEQSKSEEISWIEQELAGVRELWRNKLVQFSRVTALERDNARLRGERGTLRSQIAQAKGKIAEINLKILQIDEDLRTEVGKDLADIRAKWSEFVEKRTAAQDQLKRIDLRAPQRGRVFELAVHTIGGVVQAGEAIMLIVPDRDTLLVEANVRPEDIDQVFVGQRASLRFTAFNQRSTPQLDGEVDRIAADVTEDQKAGKSYFKVRIRVPGDQIARLNGVKLVPGMPVETFIQTSARTVISYLMKPMQDQLDKAFREK